eukprot:CAMPEP_0204268752 /NCGR_PEP_ID=MMETSP0468-20130131/14360_1 /ASSEMBLY_ACC=CAM_ASM_000383 /TAXON_ID=2969 /ORGANISM="Oxyrrhis marina" /LENGTH=197 /DNA_ID=CAMNT_0051244059 /DNA_START=40 /DNA_END=633 /DNA_ORIENTATION=+
MACETICIKEPQGPAPAAAAGRRRSTSRCKRASQAQHCDGQSGAMVRRRTPRRRAPPQMTLPVELQGVSLGSPKASAAGVAMFSMATPRSQGAEQFSMATPRQRRSAAISVADSDDEAATGEDDGPPLDFPDDVELALRSLGSAPVLKGDGAMRASFCSTDCSPRFEDCPMASCSDVEHDEEYMSDFESESVDTDEE